MRERFVPSRPFAVRCHEAVLAGVEVDGGDPAVGRLDEGEPARSDHGDKPALDHVVAPVPPSRGPTGHLALVLGHKERAREEICPLESAIESVATKAKR